MQSKAQVVALQKAFQLCISRKYTFACLNLLNRNANKHLLALKTRISPPEGRKKPIVSLYLNMALCDALGEASILGLVF